MRGALIFILLVPFVLEMAKPSRKYSIVRPTVSISVQFCSDPKVEIDSYFSVLFIEFVVARYFYVVDENLAEMARFL